METENNMNTSANSSGDTGYINVGSSGTNAANRYEQAAPDTGYTEPPQSNPQSFAQEQPRETTPPAPPKKHHCRVDGKKLARRAGALTLAAAMGFAGGYVGSRVGGYSGNRVVVQAIERNTDAVKAVTTSTGGNDMTTSQVAALVSPSVVVITTEQVVYSNLGWFGQNQVVSGAGSGVVLSADGYILTAAHVISGASQITVTLNDTDYTAEAVGSDSATDIAVLKIDATGLTPIVAGDSDALTVGEGVVVVGNPLGVLGDSVSSGIVSALNRTVTISGTSRTAFQTDASISAGNSGGGIFNMAGELVGIVHARSGSTDAENIGFAIPINTAMEVASDLIEKGYVSGRPAMGVSIYNVSDSSTAMQLGVRSYGVYITNVTAGSGAEKAGLQAGDRILSIDGNEVTRNADVTNAVSQHSIGETVEVTIARNGQLMQMTVTLGEMGNAKPEMPTPTNQ